MGRKQHTRRGEALTPEQIAADAAGASALAGSPTSPAMDELLLQAVVDDLSDEEFGAKLRRVVAADLETERRARA